MKRLRRHLLIAAAAALALVAGTASPAAAAAVNPGAFAGAGYIGPVALSAPATMSGGRYMLSADGRYGVLMQPDGNLVEYGPSPCGFLQPDNCPGPYPWWSTNTAGQPGNRVAMQSDGNLVVYRADNSVAWASNTAQSGAVFFTVRNTGALVLQRSDGSVAATLSGGHLNTTNFSGMTGMTTNQQITMTYFLRSPDSRYHLLLQDDGNLVLYGPGYHLLWSTHSFGAGGNHLVMQGDGNLVLYKPDGTGVWASGTWTSYGAHLSLQDDGNLVIYTTANQAVWSTGTSGQL
ncbi:hypothetical protein ACQP1P_21145 [Dactylosporangium sp. CA-052675]|uniref:hypothetical protein n=1 Tax=Dactylosporangium sp. CA-052675 TaxID=3239927 RepID=UPI003D8AEEC6